MQNTGQKFVERFEMAVMQYVILAKAKQGEVTKESLRQVFRGNLQMSGDHLDHCIRTLIDDGHLKELGGNKYTVTDDGREDVQKLQNVVIELPNVINGGQQQQRQGVPAGGQGQSGNIGGQGSQGSQGQQGGRR